MWLFSSVSGVDDLRVPRDQWNGEDLTYNEAGDVVPKGELFQRGGFVRAPFTFYNQGAININYGVKQATPVSS